MDRRYFLKKTWEKGTLMTTGIVASGELLAARLEKTPTEPFARRPLGKTGEQLSILGFGGILVMSVEQSFANNMVAEAVDRGINYFDVSPDYGDAEERLGPALQPYRRRSFLACKTNFRDKAGAMADLDTSLKHLRTDYFDLYQHHALTKAAEVDKILGPNGAMEAFVAAQKAGKVRYLGFSCHSVETAIAAMDGVHFDTILFPTNFVLFSKASFGPQVLEHARQKGMGYLAIKAMACLRRSTRPSVGTNLASCPKKHRSPCAGPSHGPMSRLLFRRATPNGFGVRWTWRRTSSRSLRVRLAPSWLMPVARRRSSSSGMTSEAGKRTSTSGPRRSPMSRCI